MDEHLGYFPVAIITYKATVDIRSHACVPRCWLFLQERFQEGDLLGHFKF